MPTFPIIEAAIVAAMRADTALMNFASNRVFRLEAPPETEMPFLIFKHLRGYFVDNSPRRAVDARYRIECVHDALHVADEGNRLIHAAINAGPLQVEGWHNYDTISAGKYTLTDVKATFNVYHVGMFYLIRIDQD